MTTRSSERLEQFLQADLNDSLQRRDLDDVKLFASVCSAAVARALAILLAASNRTEDQALLEAHNLVGGMSTLMLEATQKDLVGFYRARRASQGERA